MPSMILPLTLVTTTNNCWSIVKVHLMGPLMEVKGRDTRRPTRVMLATVQDSKVLNKLALMALLVFNRAKKCCAC